MVRYRNIAAMAAAMAIGSLAAALFTWMDPRSPWWATFVLVALAWLFVFVLRWSARRYLAS